MFITIPSYLLLKPIKISRMLGLSLAIFFTLLSQAEAMQRLRMHRQQQFVQQAVDLSQKATEAAQKGDFTTSKQYLNQINTLAQNPYFGNAVQNAPAIQEAKRVCAKAEQDATNAAAKKAEEEKRAKEQAISERIAFEKETAQKHMAQMEEDRRRAKIREQQHQNQPQVSEAIPSTPQAHIHQEGKSFASSLMGGVLSAAKSTELHTIPGFQTDRPKEALLDDGTLRDAALAESKTNETAQHLITVAKDRPVFKIDPSTDPLFVE